MKNRQATSNIKAEKSNVEDADKFCHLGHNSNGVVLKLEGELQSLSEIT